MLTAILVMATAIIGYKYGRKRGEEDMYMLLKDSDDIRRAFFSRISMN